jgi:hypothetical protein
MLQDFSQCFGAVPNLEQSQNGVVEPQFVDHSSAIINKGSGSQVPLVSGSRLQKKEIT